MTDRYKAAGSQAEFEAGSEGLVLVNKLGITSQEEIDDVEFLLLNQLYESLLGDRFPDRALAVADLKDWHYRWLGNVYEWAGQGRSVNLSRGDFHFAAAAQIPRLLDEFERDCLERYTPCAGGDVDALAEAIAVTHAELILIHPFREGNGRIARLLADVMAVQAGKGPLDYSVWDRNRDSYFAAIQQGLDGEYAGMEDLVAQALEH